MNIEGIVRTVTKGVDVTKNFLVDNAPIILGVKAGIGIISTSVLASQATAKSVKAIEEQEMRTGLTLNKKEKFKLCAHYYIPAAIEGISSLVCCGASIGLFVEDSRKKAGIILAYDELFDKAKKSLVSEFTKNVTENGKKIHEDNNGNTDERKSPIIFKKDKNYILNENEVLCIEPYTNQQFVASKDKLDFLANQIQALHLSNASDDRPTTLNDVLYALDLPTSKVLGDIVGWDFNEDRHIAMNFDSCLLEDATPAMVVEFNPHPWLL